MGEQEDNWKHERTPRGSESGSEAQELLVHVSGKTGVLSYSRDLFKEGNSSAEADR